MSARVNAANVLGLFSHVSMEQSSEMVFAWLYYCIQNKLGEKQTAVIRRRSETNRGN